MKNMKDMQATKDVAKAMKAIKGIKKKVQADEEKIKEKRGKHWDRLGYLLMRYTWFKIEEKKAEKAKARAEMLSCFYGVAWN